MTNFTAQINDLIARGALFVVNHSGGKDSQAMMIALAQRIPHNQIVVVHADLPGVEWEGTESHMRATTEALGITDIHVVRAGKTFLGMVEQRGYWPSPKYRQCTSDLKRGPIEKFVRGIAKARGLNLIVNCMGLRSAESCSRAKLTPMKLNAKNSVAGREWYDWLPIHALSTAEVFETISRAGQEAHWAYKAGMSRLSCVFCIMGSSTDLNTAAKLNPEMLAQYSALERKIDQTFVMPSKTHGRRFLDEIVKEAA